MLSIITSESIVNSMLNAAHFIRWFAVSIRSELVASVNSARCRFHRADSFERNSHQQYQPIIQNSQKANCTLAQLNWGCMGHFICTVLSMKHEHDKVIRIIGSEHIKLPKKFVTFLSNWWNSAKILWKIWLNYENFWCVECLVK